VADQQPAPVTAHLDATGRRTLSGMHGIAIDDQGQPSGELIAEIRQLRKHVIANLQGANDVAGRIICCPQRNDGATADAPVVDLHAELPDTLVEHTLQQRPLRCGSIAETFRLLHAQQSNSGFAPENLQLQGLVALHGAPGRCQRRAQPLAQQLDLRIVQRQSIAQGSIDLTNMAQEFGISGQGCGDHIGLSTLTYLRTLQRHALQLTMVFDFQMPSRVAGAKIIEGQTAKQQHQ